MENSTNSLPPNPQRTTGPAYQPPKAPHNHSRTRIVIERILWWLLGVINTALSVRLVLMLLGANQETPFVKFVYDFSEIFNAPFYGIFAQPQYGRFFFDTSAVVAMVVYSLLTIGIVRLINIAK